MEQSFEQRLAEVEGRFRKGDVVRLKPEVADGDTNTAKIDLFYGDIEGGVRLDRELNGFVSWNLLDLELAASRAEMDFDPNRDLALIRSDYFDHDKRVYIYSPAVDGVNELRVATVEIVNMCGLNENQIKFLTNKIADAIVEAVNG